jgi:hypothetical protein
MKTSVAAVLAVIGAFEFARVDDFVANPKSASDSCGVLDFPVRDRGRSSGHGDHVLRTQSFTREHQERGAVDTSRQGDENSAVFTQHRNCAPLFLD